MEPPAGFEPATPSLPWRCSTPELGRLTEKESKELFFLVQDTSTRIHKKEPPILVTPLIGTFPMQH